MTERLRVAIVDPESKGRRELGSARSSAKEEEVASVRPFHAQAKAQSITRLPGYIKFQPEKALHARRDRLLI
jgi:hypothetical protein